MKERTCCFIGHRDYYPEGEKYDALQKAVEDLIISGYDTFLFGSRSEFNFCCRDIVTELKEKYPHIRRVYVRAQYPYVSQNYIDYLLEDYDETYYPERLLNSGRYAYVERNRIMIDESSTVVMGYEKNHSSEKKSGTAYAYEYAVKRKKNVLNFY